MKKFIVLFVFGVFLFACSSTPNESSEGTTSKPKSMIPDEPEDDGKGVGPVKKVQLNDPLDPQLVAQGKAIYEMKCASCHKLTDQRVVGPGWKGLTSKREPEWIMNMVMNIEEMLEKDETAKELLKECLVRMPNQNLTKDNAREVLEFMYANDGKAVGNEE